MPRLGRTAALTALILALGAASSAHARQRASASAPPLPRVAGVSPRNVVFILTDDHRYDAMGFMSHPILETPASTASPGAACTCERLRHDGAVLPEPGDDPDWPLRPPAQGRGQQHPRARRDDVLPAVPAAGRAIRRHSSASGTWAGTTAIPQPGFDHWVSFKGQGSYLPSANGLNVDGKRVPQKGYITDELTDYALDWLEASDRATSVLPVPVAQGVHYEFIPAAAAIKGSYRGRKLDSAAEDHGSAGARGATAADWVRNQRNSWHGVDFPYHGTSTSATTTSDTPRRCWRSTRASAACSTTWSEGSASTRRSSSTWATTASRSASTA